MTDLPNRTPPEPGEVRQIAPGIGWIRMPLPYRVNHVNCWALDEGDHWTIIDAGLDNPTIRGLWMDLASGPLSAKPIRRLISTHGHSDHIGAAGFFVSQFGASYETTLIEYISARLRHSELPGSGFEDSKHFLNSHGCGDDIVKAYEDERRASHVFVGPQPPSFKRIRHGGTVRMAGRDWQVIVGGGHAEEHMSLYSAADKILIGGDQILPGITVMVAVSPNEPFGDPLGAYIDSLAHFEALPGDTYVLPSHGRPFPGLGKRVAELRDHYAQRLRQVEGMMAAPMSAWDVASILYERAMSQGQFRMAVIQTVAHLNHLVEQRRITRELASGVYLFRINQTPEARALSCSGISRPA